MYFSGNRIMIFNSEPIQLYCLNTKKSKSYNVEILPAPDIQSFLGVCREVMMEKVEGGSQELWRWGPQGLRIWKS